MSRLFDESYRGLGRVKKCFRGGDDKGTFCLEGNVLNGSDNRESG